MSNFLSFLLRVRPAIAYIEETMKAFTAIISTFSPDL